MKRNFKKAVSLALASTMALSLAACGGTSASTDTTAAGKAEGGDSAASNEEVTLKFSWWGGDARHEATEKAIAAFMEKYPNIKVEAEYGAWTGWEEKQALAIQGGNAADVMQINWNWIILQRKRQEFCKSGRVQRCDRSDTVRSGCSGSV